MPEPLYNNRFEYELNKSPREVSGLGRRRIQRVKSRNLVFTTATVAIIAAAVVLTVTIFLWPNGEPEQVTVSEPSATPKSQITSLYEQGEFEKVLPDLERLVEEDPDDVEVRSMLASAHMLKGDAQKAREQYSRILEIDPNHADSRYRLGILFRQQDRFDEAVRELERAVEIRPESPLFLSELAKAYVKGGRVNDAIASWQTALAFSPAASSARVGLYIEIGDAYLLLDKFEQARAAYESGLEIDGGNEHLKSRLIEL